MNTQEAQDVLRGILELAGYSIDSLEVEQKDEREFYINIMSEADASRIIGRNGDVLRSLQSILKTKILTSA